MSLPIELIYLPGCQIGHFNCMVATFSTVTIQLYSSPRISSTGTSNTSPLFEIASFLKNDGRSFNSGRILPRRLKSASKRLLYIVDYVSQRK